MLNKNRVLLAAKIAFSVGLICWLLRDTDIDAIWQTVQSARIGVLLFAFAMYYIGFWLIAVRWKLLLSVENIQAKTYYLFRSMNISMLFTNFLPSTIGGDAYRMYDVWCLGGSKTKSIAVILIDRCMGMFALVVYGVIAALLVPEVSAAIPGVALYLVGILCAMILLIWTVFGKNRTLFDWFMKLDFPLIFILQRILQKIFDALSLYQGRQDALIKAVLISFCVQFNVIVHFIILSVALNIDIPPLAMFIIIPLSTLIMLLPVSINGVGVREAILVFFFSLYGVSPEAAIAFAWVWLGFLLVQGVVGGILFVFKKNKPTLSDLGDLPESRAE